MRRRFAFVVFSCLAFLCAEFPGRSAGDKPEPHRSPMDLSVLPGGALVLTANHTSDTVSLVDLEAGKVVAEQPCGRKPVAVACSRDGRLAAVSNLWSGTI